MFDRWNALIEKVKKEKAKGTQKERKDRKNDAKAGNRKSV